MTLVPMVLTIHGFQVPLPIAFLGLVTGATYGVLAVGLVLVFRSNRVINFAHGEIGAFAAAVLGVVVLRTHLNYWIVFPFALLVGAGSGALTEVAVIRRLRKAPRLMSLVATLGAAQVLLGFEALTSSQSRTGSLFPQPPGFPSFLLGSLRITPAYTAMLILSPLVVGAIAAFLRFSRYGLAIRAAAANPDAARLASVSVSRMSTLSWAIAGALSAFTAIMIFPTQGFLSAEAFGPELMLRALAAAVIARLRSLPIALAAGLLVGEVEALLYWNYPSGGPVEAILFVLIVVALLTQSDVRGRLSEGSWSAVQGWRPVPEAWRRVWTVRHLGTITAGAGLVIAVGLPAVMSFGAAFKMTLLFAVVIAGLSLFLVTGLAGQLSLGQFALAGVGAWVAYVVASRTGNYIVGAFAGAAGAAVASVALGLTALRIRGLGLAVATLAFALMTSSWLLQQPFTLGAGVVPGRPVIAGHDLSGSKSYYYFALAFLVLATWIAANVKRGGLGRLFVAIRDNEDAARAFTVNVWARKLQAFALAGFVAGLGGSVYGFALVRISSDFFLPSMSFNTVAISVIGGIGIVAGPLLGALYIIGLPAFVPLDAVTTTASSAGWLLLILYFPAGLAGLLAPQRERLLRALVRVGGADPDALLVAAAPPDEASNAIVRTNTVELPTLVVGGAGPAGALLEVRDARKSFGGITAVAGVTIDVLQGETLGLIGPNGAGKTTLFELIAGFTRPDGGTIIFEGRSLTESQRILGIKLQRSVSPFMRARRGLIRSFQDAALFPTMTVLETVMLAHERWHPTTLFSDAVGAREAERKKRESAMELIESLGLLDYVHKQIQDLSTGTRRIVELCCLVALRPKLLLLDEPSSGIAQRESEALAGLLRHIKLRLGATLVIIEHDIPLVMGISDRVVAMESGRVIRVGTPDEVRNDPRVIESYLGGDVVTIERSNARSQGGTRKRKQVAPAAGA